MGRGRVKGKKLTPSNNEDPESGEEEKIPAQKKRGRPQKTLKDEMDDEETEMIEHEDNEQLKNDASNNYEIGLVENVKKKKRADSMKEENVNESKTFSDLSTNSNNGFRRSRRKNKPYRAAEAGVQCK